VTNATLTPPEIAERLRVSEDKVRGWILRGELAAVNVADRLGGRPRWRVSAEALAEFQARRAALPVLKIKRRAKAAAKDFVRYY
jgi:excisionase family DNA binding protein